MMSTTLVPMRARLTVAQFQKMGEAGILPPDSRVELIDGEILEMAPIGPPHVHLVNRLTRLLVRALGDEAIVSVQNPVVLDEYSEPQPDLTVLGAHPEREGRLPEARDVLLLVEVSDRTLQFDRRVKLPLYAKRSVREVWIVNVPDRVVEVHREPRDGAYRVSLERTLTES